MRKALLTAGGAAALAVFAFTGSAQAQCFWDGFSYSCPAPSAMFYEPSFYWGSPYPAFTSHDYSDYRFRPRWLPSFPGPRPN